MGGALRFAICILIGYMVGRIIWLLQVRHLIAQAEEAVRVGK